LRQHACPEGPGPLRCLPLLHRLLLCRGLLLLLLPVHGSGSCGAQGELVLLHLLQLLELHVHLQLHVLHLLLLLRGSHRGVRRRHVAGPGQWTVRLRRGS
jgi:hypothetical protein